MKRAASIALLALAAAACSRSPSDAPEARQAVASGGAAPTAVATDWAAAARERMVTEQIIARGVKDPRVLAALRKVPRHEFIPGPGRDHAYEDHPVPIGHDQTISQPYIVAVMSELAQLDPGARVLEIGTGSGYQAAVLAELAGEVYSVEILQPLATQAGETLARLGYTTVQVRAGDGYAGWAEHAPYDAIIVTAAPPQIPAPLREQLAIGGRLVIPVGEHYQELRVLTRTETGWDERTVFPVRFVPMTGTAQGG